MKIEILEGPWKSGAINNNLLRMITEEGKIERFPELNDLEEITKENKSEWKKKIGYGVAVGVVTFGIGGLVTGLMVGNKKFVEFFCELPDGRAFMGRTERKGYLALKKLCSKEKQEELEDPEEKILSKLIQKN